MITRIFSLCLAVVLVSSVTNGQETNDDTNGVVDQIIGGTPADAEEFPWMVTIVMSDGEQGCGASLIRPDWVLTAAHCDPGEFYPAEPSQVIINTLIYNTSSDQLESYSEVHDIEAFIAHDDFNFNSSASVGDIALIKLATTSAITPVELGVAEDSELYEHQDDALALGWGTTEDGNMSDVLLKANCKFFGQQECETLYESSQMTDFYANSGAICAGYFDEENPAGSASGDSGGPLLYMTSDNEYKQIGIVSRGNSLITELEFPGIYTLVTSHEEWINETIENYEGSVSVNEHALQSHLRTGIYPVPFQNELIIDLSELHEVREVEVRDIEGRLIMTESELDGQVVIDTNDWAAGSYLISILTDNTVAHRRVIKEH